MGKPMAANLLKAGHEVTVFDVSTKPGEELRAKGAQVAAKAADVAVGADAVVTMLPSSPHVKEVRAGGRELGLAVIVTEFAGLRPMPDRGSPLRRAGVRGVAVCCCACGRVAD